MATRAHIEGNKRYLSKYATKSIRIKLEDMERIEKHYQNRGFSSFSSWVLSLIYREIGDAAGDQDTGHRAAADEDGPLPGQVDILQNR